jgi:carbon monoxide dehydrogenase subunit G
MARIVRHITVDRDPTEVFDAIADFSTSARWDPGIRSSLPLDTPPVGPGASFEVTLDQGPFGPRLVYRTEVYDRPRRVVLHTRNALVEGTDDVRVEADGDGCVVTWQADFAVRGPIGRLVDPLLARGFEKVGDKAVEGLATWLREGGSARHPAAA